jgi:predicted TIM-barrel fold metal-dependent hydrolase
MQTLSLSTRCCSDHPWIPPDRWLADFDQAGFEPEVKPLILKENAIKLLKLRA